MKYWRGYLAAAIFAAISWALIQLGKTYTELVDMIYPYFTRMIQDFLANWTGSVDFVVWQLLAVVLGVILLCSIVLMIVLRWNPIQWFGWVAAVASLLFLLHTGLYGLNNYAGPLADDIKLNVSDFTVNELAEATAYYRDMANSLANKVKRDQNGDVVFPEFDELAEQAADGFHTLTYKDYYAVFAGCDLPVKKLGWSDMYTAMGITGYTFSLTAEAAVNPDIPPVSLPFTMCHEMAHRMSIAIERDANFAAFLACQANSSLEFQYSAYFMAYRYCYYALASANTTSSATLSGRIAAEANKNLRHDMDSYSQFFASRKDETLTTIGDTVNETYIKVNGDDMGLKSYDEVYNLLVNWHIQTVVLPQHVVDEGPKFDPFDETQVDLSGLPHTPVPTEAVEEP